jgi:adenylate cyclase
MPTIAQRTVTAAEIERQGGLRVDELRAFIAAFGLRPSPPDEPAFTSEEANALIELGALREIWPPELTVRLGRVWGPLLARVAQAAVQLFRLQVEPELLAAESDRIGALRSVQTAFSRLLPLVDPVLLGVHRRWLEHELAQAAVSEVENSLSQHALPGAVDVSFLFCDLKDFTAFADSHGDEAAAAAIEQLSDAVARERGEEFRLMKSLGDGVMLAYADPSSAVAAGARIMEAIRVSSPLSAHASAHSGLAIARDGDYFGGAVNVAARLLGAAGPDELVGTRPVVERTAESHRWSAAGTRKIRGVSEPVELFRLQWNGP